MYVKVETVWKCGKVTSAELSVHQAASYMRVTMENENVVSCERVFPAYEVN